MNELCGAKRKPAKNPTNWQVASLKACKGATKESIPSKANIKSGFPAVYSQIYGNCTSNAVLGCDDYYYHNKPTWIPSTAFTYYCQRAMNGNLKDGDCGSCIGAALDAVRKYGACNSKVYPNNAPLTQKPSKEAYENGLKGHEVTKYYNTTSLLQIKKALAKGYPVAASFTWPFNRLENYVLRTDMTDKQIKKCDIGHAVVIVGYDETLKRFEIRNSWGSSWGNNGYCYMTYTMAQKCIWFDDAYAVVK